MIKTLLSTAALLAASLCPLHAQIWSYEDCVEYARNHNISLQKSRLTEETSAANLEESKAQWQPSLDFSTSQGLSNYPWGKGTKTSYNSSYGLNAGWTVWNGGQRENNIKRDQLQLQIDRMNTANVMRTLETDLLQVYFNILYARESIVVCEEAVKLSEAQAERARQLMEAGKVSKVDYAQLKSQYEQDKYALVNAQGTYDTRRMELKKLLELGIDSEIELADTRWTDEQILTALPSMTESYSLALQTDAQLTGLNLEKEGTAIDVAIARGTNKPTISLNAGVGTSYVSPGNYGKGLKQSFGENIGLTLAVPIADRKKTSSAVARAKIREIDAQLDIDQRHTELSQLVENWFIDTRSAQSRFTAAQHQLEATTLSYELSDERFRLGLLEPVELMTAHNDLISARMSLLQAKYMAMLGQKMIQFYREAKITLP